jgi:hypothetical protein
MKTVASLPSKQRKELFALTATKMGIQPAAAEKDFWIVWALQQLFSMPDIAKHLCFKGGTSLSKAYGLIERFSEDIDLILDWRDLSEQDPQADRSKTQQSKLNTSINQAAQHYIKNTLLPGLQQILSPECEIALDEDDPHTLTIRYPAEFAAGYLRPVVRLEVGPLAAMLPRESRVIQSYAAEYFPQAFKEPSVTVPTILAERTFWEKLTILHAEAHRPSDKTLPPRYARHYYDVYRLANSPCGPRALSDLALLKGVVNFKQKFYPVSWANYQTASSQTLQLLPAEAHKKALKEDYLAMKEMIFGDMPSFDDVIAVLETLQTHIHQLPNNENK